MSLQNPVLRQLHRTAAALPPLLNSYRKVRDWSKSDPLVTAFYRKLFDRGRLTLPEIAAEACSPCAGAIELPIFYPLFAGEDAPLADLIFLLNLAKGRKAKRILEIGTYRARTTHALHLNCPDSEIVSYDIQVLDSPFRQALSLAPKVQLRHASFVASAAALRREPKFDLIFVDGSHEFQHVLDDSRLSLELIAPEGIVVWHDYRPNDFYRKELRVPEALKIISQSVPVYAVPGTMCAVHAPRFVKPG
jgi:hypothetical protein